MVETLSAKVYKRSQELKTDDYKLLMKYKGSLISVIVIHTIILFASFAFTLLTFNITLMTVGVFGPAYMLTIKFSARNSGLLFNMLVKGLGTKLKKGKPFILAVIVVIFGCSFIGGLCTAENPYFGSNYIVVIVLMAVNTAVMLAFYAFPSMLIAMIPSKANFRGRLGHIASEVLDDGECVSALDAGDEISNIGDLNSKPTSKGEEEVKGAGEAQGLPE